MLMTCYGALDDRDARLRASRMTLERTEAALAQDRHNGAALGYGVSALAALGERDRALEWLSRALLIDPDNRNMRYNLICGLSIDLHEVDAALDLLSPYLATASAPEVDHIEVDPYIDPLRGDARYQALIVDARARLGAMG